MPRIDPQQLLSCLSVLLSPQGGILSSTEVHRLANLMTKFSKKLVSKCVYVLILKNTETSLLGSFMAEGGWNLVHMWLQDAYLNKNWPLVKELLQLLLITPTDVERLKMNNLPKVVKGLSRRDDLPEIQRLSNDLVQLWLKIVKDETKPQITHETNLVVGAVDAKPIETITPMEVENEMCTEIKAESDNISNVAVENGETVTNEDLKENIENEPNTETEINTAVISNDKLNEKESDSDNKKKESSSSKKSSSSSSSRHKSSKSSSRDKDRDKSKSSSSSRDRHKSSSRDKDKDKSKDRHRSNGSHKSSSSSSSSSKSSSKDKDKERSKETKEKQAEKDKDTLAKVQPQTLGKMGRIPKRNEEDSKTKEVKKPSMSIEVRKNNEERPKTVKVFNAKMRSTGLLEEAKPPPPRSAVTKKPTPVIPPTLPVKRTSPVREPIPLPEKKPKLDTLERPGAIKLIPPKPKPVLQESDIFMDALNSAATANKKDVKKRKRRPSANKESTTPEVKTEVNTTPPASPEPAQNPTNEVTSPIALKPFNFYQDTLETKEEEIKTEETEKEVEEDGSSSPKKPRLSSPTEEEEPVPIVESKETTGLKGVLCHTKKKGPKRSIRWREDSELVEVQYFELDETERVNVTRAFTDMARMELSSEREALQLSRKTVNEDLMDVQTPWRPLIEIDVPSTPEVVVKSLERDIQFAREKNILQALYFTKRMIPDSPGEPDPENHAMTDPVLIPLEPTDDAEPEEPKPIMAWPEPKGSPPPAMNPHMHNIMPQPNMLGGFPPHMGMGPGMGPGIPGPFQQNIPNNFNQNMGPNGPGFPGPGFGGNGGNFMGQNPMTDWNMMHPQNMPGDQMMPPPPNGGPGMFGNDNFMANDVLPGPGFKNSHFGGPPQNQMYPNQGPPPPHNNFMGRGGRGFRRGGGGNWRMNGPGNWNRGGGGMQGGPGMNRSARICKNIKNHGYCRNRDNCAFYHPNV